MPPRFSPKNATHLTTSAIGSASGADTFSGESWSYSNWFPGEPDYCGGWDDRAAFSTVGNINPPYQATWGDVGHADTSPSYFVEYNALPWSVCLTDIHFDSQGRVVLRWESNPTNNVTYTVESCASLGGGSWGAVEPTNQWPITSSTWTNQAAGTSGQRFFRINARFQQ